MQYVADHLDKTNEPSTACNEMQRACVLEFWSHVSGWFAQLKAITDPEEDDPLEVNTDDSALSETEHQQRTARADRKHFKEANGMRMLAAAKAHLVDIFASQARRVQLRDNNDLKQLLEDVDRAARPSVTPAEDLALAVQSLSLPEKEKADRRTMLGILEWSPLDILRQVFPKTGARKITCSLCPSCNSESFNLKPLIAFLVEHIFPPKESKHPTKSITTRCLGVRVLWTSASKWACLVFRSQSRSVSLGWFVLIGATEGP